MIKNGSRHSRPLIDKIVDTFSPLPVFARQSFTFDRGTEFRGFKALEDGLGARSWFCDPNSPWQKGAVENTNIRRFVPSDTDLSAVNQPQLVAPPTISIHCPGSALVTARPPRSSWPICAIAGNPLPSTRHCCTWIRFSKASAAVRAFVAHHRACFGRPA